MKITSEDLKAHIDDHLAAAGAGELVTIIDEAGEPIAQLERADDSDLVISHDPAKRLSEFIPGRRPPRLDFDAVQWLLYDREQSRY